MNAKEKRKARRREQANTAPEPVTVTVETVETISTVERQQYITRPCPHCTPQVEMRRTFNSFDFVWMCYRCKTSVDIDK